MMPPEIEFAVTPDTVYNWMVEKISPKSQIGDWFLAGTLGGKDPKKYFLENLAVDLSENPKIIEKVLVRKENEYFEVSPKCRLLFFLNKFSRSALPHD